MQNKALILLILDDKNSLYCLSKLLSVIFDKSLKTLTFFFIFDEKTT